MFFHLLLLSVVMGGPRGVGPGVVKESDIPPKLLRNTTKPANAIVSKTTNIHITAVPKPQHPPPEIAKMPGMNMPKRDDSGVWVLPQFQNDDADGIMVFMKDEEGMPWVQLLEEGCGDNKKKNK